MFFQSHNVRRVQYMTTNLRNKKEKEEAQQLVWEGRFKRRNAEQERKKHEDSLKFFKVRKFCFSPNPKNDLLS